MFGLWVSLQNLSSEALLFRPPCACPILQPILSTSLGRSLTVIFFGVSIATVECVRTMDSDADEQAMAQAMGFSSFGAQDRPQKKRRYNPHSDAAVVSVSSEAESGGHARYTPATGANADEINLRNDDEKDVSVQTASSNTGATLEPATPISDGQVRPASLPQRPAPGLEPGGGRGGRGVQGHGRQCHQSEKNPLWYEGYYDPSSNQNPWERLEKARGLDPRGSWVFRADGSCSHNPV